MEPGYVVLIAIAAVIIGLLIGVLICRPKRKTDRSSGVLYVHLKAPEGQQLYLEQLVPTSMVASEKRVTFDVIVFK